MDKPKQPEFSKQGEHAERGEVGIWLDSYNDIFSDFDPRHYSERSLSDDFVAEVKKVSREKNDKKMSLKLSLPTSMRNQDEEKLINERLHGYFKNMHRQIKQEEKKTGRKGAYFVLAGVLLMFIASIISYREADRFYMHALLILFEPAGWFFLWSGLDHLIYFSKRRKSELEFYSKMAKADILFISY